MKAPLSWLREYVAIDLPVEELADRLAMTGTEVERVSTAGVPTDEQIQERFVVGKVLTCERHPNADKLSVRSMWGRSIRAPSCAGRPMWRRGRQFLYACPALVMPGGFEMKQVKLRGVVSSGMIMSEGGVGVRSQEQQHPGLPHAWEGW